MSNPIFHLEMPNRPRSLRMIAGALRAAMEEPGFSKPDIHHLELAVDEACTNVLEHAYPRGGVDILRLQYLNNVPVDPEEISSSSRAKARRL